jgi:hypothetical protein
MTMSAQSQAFDPYRSPSLPEGPYAAIAPYGRPGWLTMLCVCCIVLGALGLLNSLFGTFGILGGKAIQTWVQPKGAATGMPQEMQDAQEKFQNDLYGVQDRYYWFLVAAIAVRFVVSPLLLYAGIRALSLDEQGRKLLVMACAIALGFELCAAILQSALALENLTITHSYVENITSKMPKDKAEVVRVASIVKTTTRIIGIVVLVFAGLIVFLKLALYTFGYFYLRQPHIRALFGQVQRPTSNVQSV